MFCVRICYFFEELQLLCIITLKSCRLNNWIFLSNNILYKLTFRIIFFPFLFAALWCIYWPLKFLSFWPLKTVKEIKQLIWKESILLCLPLKDPNWMDCIVSPFIFRMLWSHKYFSGGLAFSEDTLLYVLWHCV